MVVLTCCRCNALQAHLFAYNAPTQLPRPAKMTSEDSQERSERGESMYAHKLQYSLDEKGAVLFAFLMHFVFASGAPWCAIRLLRTLAQRHCLAVWLRMRNRGQGCGGCGRDQCADQGVRGAAAQGATAGFLRQGVIVCAGSRVACCQTGSVSSSFVVRCPCSLVRAHSSRCDSHARASLRILCRC